MQTAWITRALALPLALSVFGKILATKLPMAATTPNLFTDTGHHPEPEDFGNPLIRAIGRLYNPSTGVTECTATLVAPDIIVTAAHCLQTSAGDWNGKRLDFVTGGRSLGDGKRLQTLPETRVSMTKNTLSRPDLDIAFIRLKKQLDPQQFPAAKLDSLRTTKETGEYKQLRLTAYFMSPGAPMNSFGTTEHCEFLKYFPATSQFTHNCSTKEGMSGAPLYILRDGKLIVLGIHVGANVSSGDDNTPTPFSEVLANRGAGAERARDGLKKYQSGLLVPDDF